MSSLPLDCPACGHPRVSTDTTRVVWYSFRSCVLHFLRSQRNAWIFENRRPTVLTAQALKIYMTFAAHVRCSNIIDRAQFDRVIATLRRSASGGVIFDQSPRLLATRSVTNIPVETIRRVFQTQSHL